MFYVNCFVSLSAKIQSDRLFVVLQGIECDNVQRKKAMLQNEGVKFEGDKVNTPSSWFSNKDTTISKRCWLDLPSMCGPA